MDLILWDWKQMIELHPFPLTMTHIDTHICSETARLLKCLEEICVLREPGTSTLIWLSFKYVNKYVQICWRRHILPESLMHATWNLLLNKDQIIVLVP